MTIERSQTNTLDPTQTDKAPRSPMLLRIQLALLAWSGLMVFTQLCMLAIATKRTLVPFYLPISKTPIEHSNKKHNTT